LCKEFRINISPATNGILLMAGRGGYRFLGQKFRQDLYRTKRTILDIVCSQARLNSENVEISLRKTFDVLRDEKLSPVSGASGTRIELLSAFFANFAHCRPTWHNILLQFS
jgi:hypothetical protein